jgi:predicted ribosome quality control (RQC) complex YloA/Tae2 family protein
MKTALSSVDLRVLSRELDGMLAGARFDKAYSLPQEGLRLRFHLSGSGGKDVVILPNYLCVSNFEYPQTEAPYSFAMGLRKHLDGSAIVKVEQHAFDRIAEFTLEGNKGKFLLIVELFSTGNVVLCDEQKKILGILLRQHWKDRILKPGEAYTYPPGSQNPLEIDGDAFIRLLKASDKTLAATIASMGLGGFYAEEVCGSGEIEKTLQASSLNLQDAKQLFHAFKRLLDTAIVGAVKPSIILDDAGDYLDVVPFEFTTYARNEKKTFPTFNEAVDEYFSKLHGSKISTTDSRGFVEALKKLELMKEKQEEALARQKVESVEHRKAGDLIYQHLQLIEGILEQIKKAKKQGLSDEEISNRFLAGRLKGIPEAKAFKKLEDSKLTLEIE